MKDIEQRIRFREKHLAYMRAKKEKEVSGPKTWYVRTYCSIACKACHKFEQWANAQGIKYEIITPEFYPRDPQGVVSLIIYTEQSSSTGRPPVTVKPELEALLAPYQESVNTVFQVILERSEWRPEPWYSYKWGDALTAYSLLNS